MENKLTDTPELRRSREAAYHAGKWECEPPPVYSGNWDVQAWCNYVKFTDPKLTGFLPYVQRVTLKW